jgi:hypothetical protein
MTQKFNRRKFLLSLLIYLGLSSLSFLVFYQFRDVKVKDILVSFPMFIPLDKVDALNVMLVILWIAPQIFLITYGFNGFHRYFQANIIYFVTRGAKLSKSYWLIIKTIIVDLAAMVAIRVLCIMFLTGQLKLLSDPQILVQMLLFLLITIFLVFVFINLYIVYQRDVMFPILVLIYICLVFLSIQLKWPIVEIIFIRGNMGKVSGFAMLVGVIQAIQLGILHRCIRQVEYK